MINSNTKLLMICPSHIRPDRIQEMLKSFDETKNEGTEIIIYLTNGDPHLKKYLEVLEQKRYFIVGGLEYAEQAYNLIPLHLYPDLPYYGIVNDDHVFLTKDWDKKMLDVFAQKGQWGLVCSNDNLTDWKLYKHPSQCIIDGNTIRLLGYMNWPKFRHIGIDKAQGKLFGDLGRLWRLEDVIVEHRHVWNNKAQWDDNYKVTYCEESQNYGAEMYQEWLNTEYPRAKKLLLQRIQDVGC